jgi:hypothetical protein
MMLLPGFLNQLLLSYQIYLIKLLAVTAWAARIGKFVGTCSQHTRPAPILL